MFRIVGLMCLITMTGETTCTTHYRDDFKTWPTHELCMPHAEAALEETTTEVTEETTDTIVAEEAPVEDATEETLAEEVFDELFKDRRIGKIMLNMLQM